MNQVFVVVGNDFPDAVFSTEQGAEAFMSAKRAAEHECAVREHGEKNAKLFGRRIHWRSYPFVIDSPEK